MVSPVKPFTAEQWFRHLFRAKSALDGGVVRRSIRDMERMVGRVRFLAEVERRGFTAVENAGQVVVFCNREPVTSLTGRGRQTFWESLRAKSR